MNRLSLGTLLLALTSQGVAAELTLPKPPVEKAQWQPTGELAVLLTQMERACEKSQEVFRPLSVEQMNWSPPDGTHTPRWNAEHLMGRQLLFFSRIYATIDPDRHVPIDLNPAQSPDAYEPGHADWTGAQEAARMQEVSEYITGHAYLLKGLDLGAQAPGSKWRLGALFRQMDRHFGEHTANVVKKSELPGWPKE